MTFIKLKLHFLNIFLFFLTLVTCDVELWEKDMTQEIYIETSHEGFEHVNLTCSKDLVQFAIKMEVDEFGAFDGVIYTRGSFRDAEPPCFFDATGSSKEVVQLSFKPDECHTKLSEENQHKNVVIIQHDDFLIFPGDLAFEIGCKFDGDQAEASLGLADPDPGAKELPKHRKSTVTSNTGFVQFIPDDIRPRKKSQKVKSKPKTEKSKKKSKSQGKKKNKTKNKTEL